MSFSPRTFDQILADMLAYVRLRTELTDFAVGSVIRTMLEAAALEDDEQYFQMTQLLEEFSLSTATGQSLERRLADFGLVREGARSATVQAVFTNDNAVRDVLAEDYSSTETAIGLTDTSTFPTSGYPYVVRIGEGTPTAEDVSVTNNNTSTATLTISALLYDHEVAETVVLVTGAVSQVVNVGTQIQAPATAIAGTKVYITTEAAFIPAGNYYSNAVTAKAVVAGTGSNIGVGQITQFVAAAPFSGAGVTNLTSGSGGLDRETDEQFLNRALAQLQSLSRGTPLALESLSLTVTDPSTQQRVASANVVEDFVEDEVTLYIDNGTGLIPDTAVLPATTLGVAAAPAAGTVTLSDGTSFPTAGAIIIDDGVNAIQLYEYVSKTGVNVLNLSSTIIAPGHNISAQVRFVDYVSRAAELNQRRFLFTNFPVVRDSELVWVNEGASWQQLERDTDYVLNRGVGELKMVSEGGVAEDSRVATNYTYYTNLIAEVQKSMEGDRSDPQAYPGVKAAGIFLSVEAPIIRRVTVRMTITAKPGFTEADLAPSVRQNVEDYISSLRIGEDVVYSRLIDVAHNVRGVQEVVVSTPASTITILENELPLPFDSDGESLVTVL